MIYYILGVVTVVLWILSVAFKNDEYLRRLFRGICGTILVCILAIYNRKFVVIPVAVLLLYIYIHDWVMKKIKIFTSLI